MKNKVETGGVCSLLPKYAEYFEYFCKLIEALIVNNIFHIFFSYLHAINSKEDLVNIYIYVLHMCIRLVLLETDSILEN